MSQHESLHIGREQSAETGSGDSFDLAIIGGGFSGLCTAYHLLIHPGLAAGFRCVLIEPDEMLGAGVAYRTDSPHHLLNVRAKGMSITETDPSSFSRWLAENAPEFTPDDFVPRGLYRRYTNDCLKLAARRGRPGSLTLLRDEVRAVEPKEGTECYRLRLKSGNGVRAGAVVLALGNLPPRSRLDKGLLVTPWGSPGRYRGLADLAIVGAGLTALDVILEAEASGFAGHYSVISPHGRFPSSHGEPHNPVPAELREWAAELAASRPGLRLLLRAFQHKRKSGIQWEHLVDSFRKHSPCLWGGFDLGEKRRFLRHFRTLWNTHLHRSCHSSMQVVSRLKESGRLRQIAARVVDVEKRSGAGDTAVRLLLQSDRLPALDADLAVNGTGLFSDILRTDSPLVAQLIRDSLALPDDFRMGFRVNPKGQLQSPGGEIQPGLFTVGTLRRGEELESTAVPEIRRQVRGMVEEIARILADNAHAE